jgi:PIN domain nuclease of toxin-antitoxin system
VLALILEEPGADTVELLAERAALSTVNWAEVWQVALDADVRVGELRSRVEEYGVSIVPFDPEDAERAAELHAPTRRAGLSLADRACLALAARLGVPAVTADRAWIDLDVGVEIVSIR